MATCPMCRRDPIRGNAKTCGDSACVSAMARETRMENDAREAYKRRQQLYGTSNEWVRWEREQRNR